MIGVPSSSWTTVSLEKPAATFSISQCDAREALGLHGVAEQEAISVHQLSRRVGLFDHAIDDHVRYPHRLHL
jgi:hypothetical protein